ncbi:MAG: hypothetical protein H6708_02660 [Kofleriaceae bacterium]|nr:hypothetical protein [Kofleriaceae bacterium]
MATAALVAAPAPGAALIDLDDDVSGDDAAIELDADATDNADDDAARDELDLDDDDGDDADDKADGDGRPPRDPAVRNVFERLRNLPVAAQLKVAREGEVSERIALERMYGKTVWEALLRNPRITHPEVTRIARMASLPRPLLELIVSNTAWLRSPEVRRALLGNLRLGVDMIPRVLRLLPKHELRLVPSQTAYPLGVRDAARRLLKDS